jgi:hypothetical protein
MRLIPDFLFSLRIGGTPAILGMVEFGGHLLESGMFGLLFPEPFGYFRKMIFHI